MKYNFYLKITILILCTHCFLSCKRNNPTANQELPTFFPLKNALPVKEMKNILETIELIELEVSNESLITDIKKVLIPNNEHLIIQSGNDVLLYDKDGKYQFNLGSRGRGPNEYISIRDICMSKCKEKLVILDCFNNLLIYNLSDGKFVQKHSVTPPEDYPDFDAICPSPNGFYLFACNPLDEENNENFYCLLEYDKESEMINKFLKRKDYVFPVSLMTQSYDNNYIIRPQEGDKICYKTSDSGLVEWLKIDFGKEHIPSNFVVTPKGEDYDIRSFMFAEYYKLPINIYDTHKQLYFRCCGPKASEHYFLTADNMEKSITWKHDMDTDGKLFQIVASDSLFFYGIYDDYSITDTEQFECIQNPLKREIVSRNKLILKDDQNPVLVKLKMNAMLTD